MPDMQTKFVAADGLRFEVLEQGTGARHRSKVGALPARLSGARHLLAAPDTGAGGNGLVADERGRPTAATPAKNPRHRARRETPLQREIAVKNVSFGILTPQDADETNQSLRAPCGRAGSVERTRVTGWTRRGSGVGLWRFLPPRVAVEAVG